MTFLKFTIECKNNLCLLVASNGILFQFFEKENKMNDFENATLDDDDDANEVVMKWRHDWKQLFSRGEIANKTIQIAPMRYYAPCRRQHYFYDIFVLRQYGEVESANIQFENDAIICGLVQYRDSKIASNLVDRGQIFIRNIEYKYSINTIE
ncbi:uncharacterized protein LOC116337280 isoform X3 [Contarinia nasturtii]|uniref:uncharacterized protein LOC116337280 isoform X3 n=1 Tax=Contarinia nasturtii TaxID=265458 RepID=UPI0012D3BA40|nr:uncharacterized protein LOC116337280 isoform X3 [Contarinia nasturtii]